MHLVARRPVVEFRFILSRPIRLSLQTLHTLHRPQCLPGTGLSPQICAQRRSLCLFKTARAKTVLGQHKVIPFDLYEVEPPEASEHLINIKRIPKKGEPETIAANISLQEAYDKYIKPGQLLHCLATIPKHVAGDLDRLKEGAFATSSKDYTILEAGSLPYNIKIAGKGKGLGALRVTPLNLSSPSDYFKLAIDRTYQFIEGGSPVEFALRFKQGHVKKEVALLPTDHEPWNWILRHYPHLRPDFILRSMPKDSIFVVDPVTNGHVLQFVIAKRRFNKDVRENLTQRLFQVKKSVARSIEIGNQAQLPKIYRQQLQAAGNTAYTPLSGLPAKLREEQTGEPEPEAEQEADALGALTMPAARDRYMPIRPEPVRKMRTDKLSHHGTLLGPRLTREYDHKAIKAKLRVDAKGDGRKNGLWEKARKHNFSNANPFR